MLGAAAAFTVAALAGGGATAPALLAATAAFTAPVFACDETLTATVLRTTLTIAVIAAGPVHPVPPVFTGNLTVTGQGGTATISGLTGSTTVTTDTGEAGS
jgi:hypothetical protein